MAYAKRYPGGFVDLPAETTAIDSQYLNGVETSLAKLDAVDPSTDGQVLQWAAATSKYGVALLLDKNIDPAANLSPAKLAGYPSDATKFLSGAGTWVTPTSGSLPGGGSTGQVLTKQSATNYDTGWTTPATPPPVVARVATTVAGLGAPVDGAMGLVRCGASPFDFVSVIYDATYGKWVSAPFPLANAPGDTTTGTPVGSGSTSFLASWPSSSTVQSWFPVKNCAARYTAGLNLQMQGGWSISAVDAATTAFVRMGAAFTAGPGLRAATWTSFVGPVAAQVGLAAQGGIVDGSVDWTDVTVANFPGLTTNYWGRLQLMAAAPDATHRVRACAPLIYGRWVG